MKRKKTTQPAAAPANPLEDSLGRFLPLLPPADQASLLEDLQVPLRQSLRVNPHKTQPGAIHAWAAHYGWTVEPIPYCSTGWRVEPSAEGTLPSGTIEHRLGQFYIQDAASMLPVELFERLEEVDQPLILDLAASPGGRPPTWLPAAASAGWCWPMIPRPSASPPCAWCCSPGARPTPP